MTPNHLRILKFFQGSFGQSAPQNLGKVEPLSSGLGNPVQLCFHILIRSLAPGTLKDEFKRGPLLAEVQFTLTWSK